MKFKLETKLDFFLLFIIFVKLVFVISAVGHLCLSHVPVQKDDNDANTRKTQIDNHLVYWKQRTEFAFIISMSILLVYHFNPYVPDTPVHPESKVLFFMFGLVLILTAKWSLFVTEAPWYKRMVELVT